MAGEAPQTPMGGVSAFNCRNCGGQVNLLAPGQTLSAACSHCGAVADLTDPNFRVLNVANAQMTRQPLFPIGTRLQFEDKPWVLIGFMVRQVREFGFEWEEYLLFNPYHGFRFLGQAYGHWSWIKMVQDLPIAEYKASAITYQNRVFSKLTSGVAEVMYVIGECYWQVAVGDKAETADFVSPPMMLSREIESGGLIWSLGQYLEPEVVATMFGVERSQLPRKRNVGANQPNPHKANLRRIRPIWWASMGLTFLIGILLNALAPNKEVFYQNYDFPFTEDTVTKSFTLEGGTNNLEIKLLDLTSVTNHWIELSGELHSLTTNMSYDVVVPVEYYEGYDDGHWVEGAHDRTILLDDIPAGEYELVASIASDTTGRVNVRIARGVPIYGNWFLVLILLSIYPVYLFFMGNAFEKKRQE